MKTAMKAVRAFLCGLVAVLWLPAFATTTDIYYHNDLAGTPLAATDASGNLLWRQGYKPYGERLDPKAPSEQQPWFTGKAHVEAAGLSYFGARWYDPQLGRFMGVDPRGFDEANIHSFNRYAYANNNPYRFVDPDGRSPFTIFAIEAAKATGLGYVIGVAADAISQGAAFGSVDWAMAATSSAAIAGGEAGLFAGALSGANAAKEAARAGTIVFKSAHYASRLEAAGVNVARAETEIGKAVGVLRPDLAVDAAVRGRMSIDGVLVEYRAMLLPNGTVNVGTIFPVVP